MSSWGPGSSAGCGIVDVFTKPAGGMEGWKDGGCEGPEKVSFLNLTKPQPREADRLWLGGPAYCLPRNTVLAATVV